MSIHFIVNNMADVDTNSDSDGIGLELSFSSSSYDPYSPSEDDEIEYEASGGIQPYMFEPDASDSDSNEPTAVHQEPAAEEGARLLTTDWCDCGNCIILPTAKECVCCHEIPQVNRKMTAFKPVGPNCIIDHPGFQTVCLDEYVLETAYFQYCQEYRQEPTNSNEERRYIGYRQLVRWCWGFLGRTVRVPLPSCAVKKIRETFPAEEYTGFKDFE